MPLVVKVPPCPPFGPPVTDTFTETLGTGSFPLNTVTLKLWLVPTRFVADGGVIVHRGASHVFVAVHENGMPLNEPLASMVSVPGPRSPL